MKRGLRYTLWGAAALLIGGVGAALVFVPAAGWRTNDVTTGQTPEYPKLRDRIYDFPPDQTLTFAAAAIARLPRWTVVSTDPQQRVVHAEVKTILGNFTDDVWVRVFPDGDDLSRVQIRAKSRVGHGDLGENARHITALQKAMDDKLPRAQGPLEPLESTSDSAL